jgi:Ca-activated chloride channel family protein
VNVLSDFHFVRPLWLLLLPLIGLLSWQLRRGTDPLRGWRRLIEPGLLSSLTVGGDHRGSVARYALPAAWLIALIAVAGPTWQRAPSPFGDNDVPVMLVMKATQSMNAADLAPSRQARAHLEIADLATERPGLPLGLVAYAGTAHLALPPTRDVGLVASMAGYIDSQVMPVPGDDLAAALSLAARSLAGGESSGLIVLLADSVQGDQRSALQAFRAQYPAPVAILPLPGAGASDDSLQAAARLLGADVVRLSADQADSRKLVRLAAAVPAGAVAGEGNTRWQESGYWLVPLIAPLLLLGFRRRANVASMLVLAVLCSVPTGRAEAQQGNLLFSADQMGQRLFARGEYLAAAEHFADSQWKGVAYYRAGEFEQAEQAFARGVTAEDFYNRGNALLMQGKYAEAISQYDQALDLRNSWVQAAKNRELAQVRAERMHKEAGDMTGGKMGADGVVFDLDKSAENAGQETVLGIRDEPFDDETLEALWLRNVQTEPGDFLRSKFSYQVAEEQAVREQGGASRNPPP